MVCDTGPLVAAAIVDDAHHRESVDLCTSLHLSGERVLVPATVVAEVGYLISRDGNGQREAELHDSMADGTFHPVQLTMADYRRSAELVRQYAARPLGTTDATVIALCERLGLTEVPTHDHRTAESSW